MSSEWKKPEPLIARQLMSQALYGWLGVPITRGSLYFTFREAFEAAMLDGDGDAMNDMVDFARLMRAKESEEAARNDLAEQLQPVIDLAVAATATTIAKTITVSSTKSKCAYCSVTGKFVFDGTNTCLRHIYFAWRKLDIYRLVREGTEAIVGPVDDELWKTAANGYQLTKRTQAIVKEHLR